MYITLRYGDPSQDGHGITETVNIETNHCFAEIAEAYRRTEKQWQYGLTTQAEMPVFCDAYNRVMPDDFFQLLWDNGYYLTDEESAEETAEYIENYGYHSLEETFDIVSIYMFMAQQSLKDLSWSIDKLQSIHDLYIGYGLTAL